MLSLTTILAALGGGSRRRRDRGPTPPGRTTESARGERDDDLALARRFAAGDHDAVRALYQRHGRAVFAVAYAALGDRHLATEAVQVTFLKAWRAADRYDPTRPFSSWIYSIARRAAIDVGRRERRHAADAIDERNAPSGSVGMEHVWDAWQVRRAVDALNADEQQIVRLQHFDQLTHSEIAQRLQLPVGTVKSRSHRAHRRLATALAHLQEEVVV